MKCFMKLNNDLLLKKFFFKVIAIKKYFLPLLSIIIISCGGEDDSVEVPTPKFLENNDQKVYADGSGTNETDYMFFYNNPNGFFLKYAQQETQSEYYCIDFISGDGQFGKVTITKHDSNSLFFNVTDSGDVLLSVEIYEAKGSNGTSALNVKLIDEDGDVSNLALFLVDYLVVKCAEDI